MNVPKRPKNLTPQGNRVWDCFEEWLHGAQGRTMKQLAGKVKMTPESLTRVFKEERGFRPELLRTLAGIFGVNPDYLLMSSGMKYITETPAGKATEFDEMKMALEVLGSDTHYAESLKKNIRSFHGAIEDKRKLYNEIQILRSENNELKDKVTGLEDKIRALESAFFSKSGQQNGEMVSAQSQSSPEDLKQ